MKPLYLFTILLISSPFLASAQNCNPNSCKSPGTYCCAKSNVMTCADDESECNYKYAVCSTNCRSGCCIDNDRCGTTDECKAFPIYSLIVGFGVLILFIVSVSIYRIRRNRQMARLRIIAINGSSGHMPPSGEISITNLIPTGVVVNNNRRIRGPPIKEVSVQPYQQQDIVTENKVMTQPYGVQRQPQQFNYDQIEYALPPGSQSHPLTSQSQQPSQR